MIKCMHTDQTVSIEKTAAREGFGLAGSRFSTQLFSWLITIIIARLLSPEDYGFMEMATIARRRGKQTECCFFEIFQKARVESIRVECEESRPFLLFRRYG